MSYMMKFTSTLSNNSQGWYAIHNFGYIGIIFTGKFSGNFTRHPHPQSAEAKFGLVYILVMADEIIHRDNDCIHLVSIV
jgi:hypothetical protein